MQLLWEGRNFELWDFQSALVKLASNLVLAVTERLRDVLYSLFLWWFTPVELSAFIAGHGMEVKGQSMKVMALRKKVAKPVKRLA